MDKRAVFFFASRAGLLSGYALRDVGDHAIDVQLAFALVAADGAGTHPHPASVLGLQAVFRIEPVAVQYQILVAALHQLQILGMNALEPDAALVDIFRRVAADPLDVRSEEDRLALGIGGP